MKHLIQVRTSHFVDFCFSSGDSAMIYRVKITESQDDFENKRRCVPRNVLTLLSSLLPHKETLNANSI